MNAKNNTLGAQKLVLMQRIKQKFDSIDNSDKKF